MPTKSKNLSGFLLQTYVSEYKQKLIAIPCLIALKPVKNKVKPVAKVANGKIFFSSFHSLYKYKNAGTKHRALVTAKYKKREFADLVTIRTIFKPIESPIL